MNEMRFDDDVAIITGAGRGLGREHALAFAQRGARLVVNDIDEAAVAAVVDEIKAKGGRAIGAIGSVTDDASVADTVLAAIHAFGRATILVNNAGIIGFSQFGMIDPQSWRRMMDVTVDGAFRMSQQLWPLFRAQGHGRIINTTSNAGFAGAETLVHYGTAKMAVAGLTRALAQEAKGTGITVNAIAPMAITRMNQDAFFGGADPDTDNWQEDIRAGRLPMGPPSIVSPTVLWLAHRSTTINGEIFSTSSGKVARLAFVLGDGYFDPGHTPETLRDHAAQIRSIERPFEPGSTGDELALIPPLFGAA